MPNTATLATGEKLVVAKFSTLKTCTAILFASLLFFPIYVAPVLYAGGPITFLHEHPKWAFIVLTCWIVGVRVFGPVLLMAKQLLLEKGAAIWIEDRKLIYNNAFIWSLDVDLIHAASAGALSLVVGPDLKAIKFSLSDGRVKSLTTGLLADPLDIVISNIQNSLNEMRVSS